MGVKTRKLGNINNQIVEWQSVHVSDGSTALTTVAGRGYFIDTTSGTQTVNLPGTPRFGDRVSFKDFARTWNTNKITFGSNKFDGVDSRTPEFDTQGQTISLIYMGSTKGWSLINEDTTTGLGAQFVTATGGTVATSGNFKIHTFTGDSNFVVSNAGNSAGSNTVDYLVVAGGGGGGSGSTAGAREAGGGGAGGFRLSNSTCMPAPLTSPLATPTGITVSAQTYPVTVGGGGSAGTTGAGTAGSNSIFSTITSAGGGNGAAAFTPSGQNGGNGGSGGGGAQTPATSTGAGGTGNTPPVSPAQGTNGGGGAHADGNYAWGGGGGGAGGAGSCGNSPTPGRANGGSGGIGSYVIQTGFAACNGEPGPVGSTRYFASGGAGGAYNADQGTDGLAGGGGDGGNPSSSNTSWPNPTSQLATPGAANTGGGGGGSARDISPGNAGAGGKGIVIIRYKFQAG
jgi:hypothetical protein